MTGLSTPIHRPICRECSHLLKKCVEQLDYSEASSYCGCLRQFQRFVSRHSPHRGLTERVFRTWIRKKADQSPRSFVIRQTQFIKGFLDWLVQRSVLPGHPLDDLQRKYQCRSIRAIAGALISSDPDQALRALRPLPHYGSHLGSIMCEHVQRMRTLGYRYGHENVFLHFDRFLQQQRPDADHESMGTPIREYVAAVARSMPSCAG
jgi:integrase/recombinase XerD